MRKSLEDRFWEKVDKSDGCWNWTAGHNGRGYGAFYGDGTMLRAHRVSYELHYGPIPKQDSYHGMCVCHSCDNKLCVNPDHLFLGTHQDNMDDMYDKGRDVPLAGIRNGNSKLTESDVLNIRKVSKHGLVTQKNLSILYGVSVQLISRVINRGIWSHV